MYIYLFQILESDSSDSILKDGIGAFKKQGAKHIFRQNVYLT